MPHSESEGDVVTVLSFLAAPARLALAGALLLCLSAAAASADQEEYAVFSAGAFDINDDKTTAEFRAEYWSGFQLLNLWDRGDVRPFGGVMFTGDSAAYAYAGVLLDFPLGRRLNLTLSFAPGAFHRGDGKNLGHGLEFRSQIELAYRFSGGSRLGLAFSHMSNASISENNPGAESLVLTYAFPLSGFLE